MLTINPHSKYSEHKTQAHTHIYVETAVWYGFTRRIRSKIEILISTRDTVFGWVQAPPTIVKESALFHLVYFLLGPKACTWSSERKTQDKNLRAFVCMDFSLHSGQIPLLLRWLALKRTNFKDSGNIYMLVQPKTPSR